MFDMGPHCCNPACISTFIMAFDALPEELFNLIANYAVSAQCLEDDFTSSEDPSLSASGNEQLVSFKNRGVQGLSSMNTTLRRICTPMLFSGVVLRRPRAVNELEEFGSLTTALERVVRGIEARRSIAHFVTYVKYDLHHSFG
jgi:hypothetical protein